MRAAVIRRAATAVMRWLCCISVFLLATPVWADETAGLAWLQAQVQTDGSLSGEEAGVALPLQSRSETAATLQTWATAVPPALWAAIEAIPGDAVEILARKALAQQLHASGTVSLDALIQQQNTDGGFGAASGYASNVQDTAWALAALAGSRAGHGAVVNQAVTWLVNAQQPNGQWALAPFGDALMPTAQAVQALHPYRQTAAVAAALAKARAWLHAERGASPAWGASARTAQALLAVLPGLATATAMQPAVDALRGAQRADGSWDGSPYATALALRALHAASQPVTDPDLASLQGTVLDADTGAPVPGAMVRLVQRGVQGTTDGAGQFRWTQLAQGADQLDIQATGYRPLSSMLHLEAGQQLDLGTIRLKAASGGGSNGVTLAGVARYFNGSTYYAASGAKIQAAGQTATADSGGSYRLDGLPAGRIDVTATYAGYPAIQTAAQAQAGQAVDFSPVFQQARASTATLSVWVTDAATGSPLPGATAASQTASRSTDAQGLAQFTSGLLQVGRNTLAVTKLGYERALVTFDAMDGQNLSIPIVLAPAPSPQTTLRGIVTDAGTQQPLAGVAVQVVDPPLQTTTDAQGAYTLVDAQLNGIRTVELRRTGYLPHTQSITISAATVNVFNVPLHPQAIAAGPAHLDVSVLARGAGTPLAGASVVLSGANQRSVITDAVGQASLASLNPGETHIVVAAPGFESAMASASIKAGQTYQMPVELLALSTPQPKLYGHVVDAVSQQPVGGAQVVLAGATVGTATTAANGYYEFAGITPGDVQITVSGTGYATAQRTFRLEGTTEARLPLVPNWQAGASSAWEVFGTIVDADSLEPLVGADLVLEEVLLGSSVLSSQSGSSQLGGNFAFHGLTEANGRILIRLNGYDAALIPFTRQSASQPLGTIKLKRSYNAALPDLMLGLADRSALVMAAHTFKASGKVTARVTNNSNYDAAGFDAIAFLDTDGNQVWDPSTDTLLGKVRVASLAAQQSEMLEWNLQETQLPFRDAPLYLMVDSGLEVIENIEGNNTLRVGVSCAGGGGMQDVGVCIDTSGSVSHLYSLEMDGVIKAVENPNIIPHDGSVRFMLGTDYEMYYGSNIVPLHPAQVITPATLPQLIQDLKTKRNTGGYSSGPTCVRRMSEYMKSLPQQAGSRTVITVGDGYWEGISMANSELPKTVANGVGRVDVIGIGSVNLPELEANAWPQPANTLHGGRVTVAYSAGEVASAMAQTLGAAAQTVDLTLGNFQVLDQGVGRPVALQARIGNAGSPSQATTVRFYQGAVLLGEVAMPALQTGQWLDATLAQATLAGAEPLVAVVDEQRSNAECNTSNNRQQAGLLAANRVAQLQVQTDQATYPAHAPVQLGALAHNLGSFPAAFGVVLAIEDAQGDEVARFAAAALGTLAAGAQQPHAQPWNTATLQAGTYTLRGWLLDLDGTVAAQDSTLFAVVAGPGPAAPLAALAVSADRKTYPADALVHLDSLARNLAANAPLNDAAIVLTVHAPSGAAVFSHEHPAQQLAASGLRSERAQQRLASAPLGTYTVQAELLDAQRQVLAQAATHYEVVADAGPPAIVNSLTGTVALARASVKAGEPQARDDMLHNTGSAPMNALKVARVITSASGAQQQRQEALIDLPAGGQHQWLQTPVATAALAAGHYTALLVAELGGHPVVLDQKTFEVLATGTPPPGPPPGPPPSPPPSPRAIPALNGWGMAALAMCLALCGAAGAARRRRRSTAP